MRLFGWIVCVVLSIGGPVHAGPTLPEAKAAYQEGLRQYNAEHYAEAAQAFERSYALQGRPLLLFNIAQCQRKMGAFERALETYRRYLSLVGPTDPPATVSDARGYVVELEAYMAQQRELAARVPPPTRVEPPPTRVEPPPARVEPPPARVVVTPDAPPRARVETNTLVATPPATKRPKWKSPGLWAGVGVGAVVVIGLGLGLGLGLGHGDGSPDTTLGTFTPRYP